MSEKQYEVPEKMLEAAMRASLDAGLPIGPSTELKIPIEAALRWLSENPITPSTQQWSELYHSSPSMTGRQRAAEWQRRMFIKPEPQEPEELQKILHRTCKGNYDIIEAYHLGRRSKEKP